jgi:hypothetical protein
MRYKVSFVVGDDSSPGMIKTQATPPQVGDTIQIYSRTFVIKEVAEITPPKNDEQFMIVTLREVATAG